MNEVHRPGIVRTDCDGTVIAQLDLYPPFRRLVPELLTQSLVDSIDFLDIDAPAFAVEGDVHSPVAMPHTRLTDLPDPLRHGSLIPSLGLLANRRQPAGAAGLIVKRRTVKPDGPASLWPHRKVSA
jgi:hypothetical protein